MIWNRFHCEVSLLKLKFSISLIIYLLFWIASVNVKWLMGCFNSKLAVISNLWTQRVDYHKFWVFSVQHRNGITLCGSTPIPPVGLIFSMPIDKEGKRWAEWEVKGYHHFVITLLSSTSSCAEWFSRSDTSMEVSLVMQAFLVVT